MNKKYFFTPIFLSASIIVLALAINYAAAQSEIQYPVKELGNCANETACGTYCDKPSNTESCLNFAEQHGLMSVQEIETARKFLDADSGPGGCKTKDACETYCDSVSHIDECVAYAEKNGLMPPQQLEEAKKIQAAKNRGVKMPACGSKKQCDAYCSEPDNMEECITFAQEAGFMSAQELEESKKMLTAIKAGAKPPPCKGKAECDVYCTQEEHFDACLEFALAAGMMDPKEAEMAKKTKGKGPGGCRSKEECDAFCQQEGNMEICAQFAYENGMMTKEEFEMMKKTGGKGPAGCKSKEECENFCNNPDNQETCFNFAKENGMIPEEDIKRMEEGKQQFKEAMQNIPPEVYSCLESAVGPETMAKFKSGEAMPPKEIGDKMRICFEQNMKPREPGAPGEGGSMPPRQGDNAPGNFVPGTTGPGGCTSPEGCQKYCESNQEECKNFQSPAQPMPGGAPMPGSNSMPCEGENCPPPPSAPSGGTGPAVMPPCESGNCPPPPSEGNQQYQPPQQPMQPGTQVPPEGFVQPPKGYISPPPPTQGGAPSGVPGTPPSGGPPAGINPPAGQQPFTPPPTTSGGGGNLQPGEYVPPAPASGENTPPPSPPPQEQPTSFLDSFLGLMLYPFKSLLR